MKLNTRVHDRIRFKTWVKVILKSGPGMLGHIEDVSTAGIGVEHDKPVTPDTECHVYFMLPFGGHERIVQARCRIASCRPIAGSARYHIGLAFVEFVSDPRTTTELIEGFVKHLEHDA
jgi:hypothetical protein